MAETLGSFRIIEEQPTGRGGKNANDNDVGGKVLPERQISGTGQSSQVGGASLKDSGGTAIDLESNASSLDFDASSRIANTGVDTDVYSEDPTDAYDISDTDAEYAEMVARLGDAYGKIINVDGDDALLQAANDIGQYRRKDIDPAKMDALARGLVYGSLKQVVSELEAKANPASSPAANGGGSGSGKSDGYSPINENGSNTSNSALRADDLNVPTGTLGTGIDPYENILPTLDEFINEMYEPEESDYSDVDEDAGGEDADYNEGDKNYFKIKGLNKDFKLFEGLDKWDLRCMPDAMSNMFDVYFRICDNDTDFDGARLDPELNSIVSGLFGSKLLSARIQTIEIPAYERATTQVTALGATLERPTDIINTPGQSSFTIRGDTRLLYIDFMNELSGTSMADYYKKGSTIFGFMGKTKVSRTETFLAAAKEKSKQADKDLADATKTANDKAQEEIENIKAAAVEAYKAQKKDMDGLLFNQKAEARAKSQNISLLQAKYELMEEEQAATLSTLKSMSKMTQEKAAAEADGFWAAQKEKRKAKKEFDSVIKSYTAKINEDNKAIDDALKKAAKETLRAKKSNIKAKVEAYTVNKEMGPMIDASDRNAVNYIVGAIARNMSIRTSSSCLESLDKLGEHKRVDIIVKRVMPGKRFKSAATAKMDERFVFEDVKLLGCSTPIGFNRESADTKDFTYNFIYKRFYKLDYYNSSPADWVQSQIDGYADLLTNMALDATKKALKSVL